MDFLSKLFMTMTRPQRMGTNMLAQGYGPIARSFVGAESDQPGRLENYIRGGISPQEQSFLDGSKFGQANQALSNMGAELAKYTPVGMASRAMRNEGVGDVASKLFMGISKPYRMGANVLAQGYGPIASTIAGRGADQPGRLESYVRGGITPEEQRLLDNNPYKEMFKSVAGMGAGMLPFTGAPASLAGSIGQGVATGGMGGYGYSPEGKELQSTLFGAGLGGALGAGGHWLRNRGGIGVPDKASGDRGFGTDSFQVKIEQGGDKALNAEAEKIGQAFSSMDGPQQAQALQRIDEIIRTMRDPGQISQVEMLKKYLALSPLFHLLNRGRD